MTTTQTDIQEIEIITGPKYGSVSEPTDLGIQLLKRIESSRRYGAKVKVSIHPTPKHRLNFETLLIHCAELVRQGKDVIFHAVEEEVEWLSGQTESQKIKSLRALNEGLKFLPGAFDFNKCHCPRVGRGRFIFIGPLPSGLNDERDLLKWKIHGMIDALVSSNCDEFGHYSLARHMPGWDSDPLSYFDETGTIINDIGEEEIIRGLNLCLTILVLTYERPYHAIGTNDPIRVRVFDSIGLRGALAFNQFLKESSVSPALSPATETSDETSS